MEAHKLTDCFHTENFVYQQFFTLLVITVVVKDLLNTYI